MLAFDVLVTATLFSSHFVIKCEYRLKIYEIMYLILAT